MQESHVLETKIEALPATRSTTISRFNSVGIKTYADLLKYIPRRYDDRSIIASIFSLQVGDKVSIIGSVSEVKNQFARNRLTIQTADITDDTGTISAVWFNQRYLTKALQLGQKIAFWGEIKLYRNKKVILPQEFEIVTEVTKALSHVGAIVPVYQETRGLSSKTIREKILFVMNQFKEIDPEGLEFLPQKIIEINGLLSEQSAYIKAHKPLSVQEIRDARHRLAFDELFILQLAAHLTRQQWDEEKVGTPMKINLIKKDIEWFISSLPFTLTNAQKKSVDEVMGDLSKSKPMNRFLQGDVGSGKTIVAAVAAFASFLNGYKTLIMAPTEILAQQHYATFQELFKNTKVKVALVTGGKSYKVSSISNTGKMPNTEYALRNTDIIIGTHALLHKKFEMNKIGLVVIDEQHRFGVKQRSQLKQLGINPHLLTMTATPIPRTAALTIFGELDMSIIDEMPLDRLNVKSWVVPSSKRTAAYGWIEKQIQKGDQIFVICPLIDESENESLASTRAAQKEFSTLSQSIFPNRKLALIHGKMKSIEKELIMKTFKSGDVDILVSTSVVEVGIDIPNATVIIIEGAERFGLAQLHQLRGRVGRGKKQSYCLLFTSDLIPVQTPRLSFFAAHPKGIDISEYDLQHRGAGEIYGTQQHGYSDLKIASLSDYALIQKTQEAVKIFTTEYQLKNFPNLQEKIKALTIESIARD
ncbi:MAG: ATP-dependent DNA helicase RecG [Microgenomates group bacterium]